jgi:hypothetical protein
MLYAKANTANVRAVVNTVVGAKPMPTVIPIVAVI